MKRKSLQELTIKDNFLFGAVMSIEENCRKFLEMALGFSIAHVEVSKEKSLIYHPEYKGIRLDIYANDENHTHYNVEMQMTPKKELGRRSRYYHSQVDMELLQSGHVYEELPSAYVIFICSFDPFDKQRYCYTFRNQCLEDGKVCLRDGSETLFLSTEGKNTSEVPESLVKFLQFVKADLEDSEKDFKDAYVQELQKSIYQIKRSREMGERYMVFEEMMRDERNEGRKEGRKEGRLEGKREAVLKLLEVFGTIPQTLSEQILSECNSEKLDQLLREAASSTSLEAFIKESEKIFTSQRTE